jgi:hypothetical protein
MPFAEARCEPPGCDHRPQPQPAMPMVAGLRPLQAARFLTCIKSIDCRLQVFFRQLCPEGPRIRRYLQLAAPRAPISDGGYNMADNNDDDIPFMQKLLDNHFLLLFLGVASPGLLYILWGIIDIMNTPLAR